MLAKFEVSCLVGTHTIKYSEVILNDDDSYSFNQKLEKLNVESRVVRLIDDKTHAFGM